MSAVRSFGLAIWACLGTLFSDVSVARRDLGSDVCFDTEFNVLSIAGVGPCSDGRLC